MVLNQSEITEIPLLLVGAGPIGIEMAIALKRNDIPYLHIEAACLGSTIHWYAPGTAFFSSPERLSLAGVPFEVYPNIKATREEYLLYLRNIVKQFNLNINFFLKLKNITKLSSNDYLATFYKNTKNATETGKAYQIKCKKIILAIGDMHQPNYLNISGEDNNPFVSHYLMEPSYLAHCKVTIVGAKNSAIEAAIRLYKVGAKVTLINRNESIDAIKIKPWLLPEFKSLVRENKINLINQASPIDIEESDINIKIKSEDYYKLIKIKSDYILLLTGYRQDPSLFKQIGIELLGEELVPKINPQTCETNINNIYVIGTAVAGTQLSKARLYIENSHIHINQVMKDLGYPNYPNYSEVIRPEEYRES